MIASPHIGAKVFLNIFSVIFAYAPTKVRLFKAELDPYTKEVFVVEIPNKGAS
jgi:hypothetical protein